MFVILIVCGWCMVVIGMFVICSAVIGLIRFPDFFTKIHAAGLIDSCAVPLILVGLACLQSSLLLALKLVIAAIIGLILSPMVTHALAKAAVSVKIQASGTVEYRK